MVFYGCSVVVTSLFSQPLCLVAPATEERRRGRRGLCQLWWRMNWETAARLSWSCRVRWSGWVGCSTVQYTHIVIMYHHHHSLTCNAYTAGQPLSVSDSVTVADMSSAVIGLSVTVAMEIITSVIMVIISLTVIIVLCQCQGAYGDNELTAVCVISCTIVPYSLQLHI